MNLKILCLTAVVGSSIANAQLFRYKAVEIPRYAVASGTRHATALNNRGQVSLWQPVAAGPTYGAFVWDALTGLHLLSNSSANSFTYGANDWGDTAGMAVNSLGEYKSVLYPHGGGVTNLPISGNSEAVAITLLGAVAGNYLTLQGWRSYSYRDGRFSDIGSLGGGTTFISDLSETGTIVGQSTDVYGNWAAILCRDGQIEDITLMIGLDAAGYQLNTAPKINAYGVVVANDLSAGQAFLIDPSNRSWITLKPLPFEGFKSTQVNGINDGEIAYGYSIVGATTVYGIGKIATLWAGIMSTPWDIYNRTVNKGSSPYTSAVAVNNVGQILVETADDKIFYLTRLCAADFDANGVVDVNDLVEFEDAYAAGLPSADFNENGIVDPDDWSGFMFAYENNEGCPPVYDDVNGFIDSNMTGK